MMAVEPERIAKKQNCYFCNSCEDIEYEYGKFLESEGFSIHYYCLLTATGLPQNSSDPDNDHLLGFLREDVINYRKTLKRKKCFHCKKRNASIRCDNKHCHRKWHLKCGNERECNTEFFDKYKSYCFVHRPQHINGYYSHTQQSKCFICFDGMGDFQNYNSITPPCCKNGWFHRKCLKRFAYDAGYMFNCPICRSTYVREFVKKIGIYVPDKPAVYKTEAEESLLHGYKYCEAKICKCPEGREYNDDSNYFTYMCFTCAGFGVHSYCANIKLNEENFKYQCFDCIQFNNKQKELQTNNNNDKDINNNSSIDEVLLDIQINEYIDSGDINVLESVLNKTINEDETERILNELEKEEEEQIIDLSEDFGEKIDTLIKMPKPKIIPINRFFPRELEIEAIRRNCQIMELQSRTFKRIVRRDRKIQKRDNYRRAKKLKKAILDDHAGDSENEDSELKMK